MPHTNIATCSPQYGTEGSMQTLCNNPAAGQLRTKPTLARYTSYIVKMATVSRPSSLGASLASV